ncbi:gliding motility-associated C-terminal domain-containing protein [Algoriphagus sp. PAP.12]|uniref:T9SS type B sorting domain-containing protein n=1 Tax=Algoriphagus sp. PAP.12 TaxID=2996678 RepID=UPI00227A80D6|nr:gliding motility-associated C-terminal domain-containing protein [Algoriphagus sp. PAP.12]
MKSIYLTLILILGINTVFAQTTPIPDSNFENFLIAQGIDSNGANGIILNSDAAGVTTLNVTNGSIVDFSGLEAFVDLENFSFSGNEVVTTLDFSGNPLLRDLNIDGGGYPLDNSSLLSLDLSNNNNLESIRILRFGSLNSLTLPNTPDQVIYISLRDLSINDLDLTHFDSLETLLLSDLVDGTNINSPSEQNSLRVVNIQGFVLGNVDLSNYPNLESVYLFLIYVQNLTLPNSSTLTDLTVSWHRLQHSINLSNVPNLVNLEISTNLGAVPLVIDLTGNMELVNVDLSDNDLNSIDLTQNTLIEDLRIGSNNLTSLDLSQNPSLSYLTASRNQLPGLDVTQNLNLEMLSIDNNLFTGTGLDLSQNPELFYINCSNNQIESLDISHNLKLDSFDGHHNLFSGTDIMDQFFTIKSNNGGLYASDRFDISFNNLSGTIPDFASLVNSSTNYFRFRFNDNNFHFGDFELDHEDYLWAMSNDNLFGGYPLPIMTEYLYAPQGKVEAVENISHAVGTLVTLTTTVRGSQNHYQWYKDGVAIPSAPDSPDYVFYASPCDGGVYHCVVTSDLVPFENGDPPGTQGKNLEIVRNDITLNVTGSYTKQCVDLTDPLHNASNVPITSNITWEVATGACGYKISLGTNAAANNILANVDLGNTTTYDPTTDLTPNTTYFVRVIPYYTDGDQTGCAIQQFSTGAGGVAPGCTSGFLPADGDTDVPVDSSIQWDILSDAMGYYITIGTSPGGNDILDALDINSHVYVYPDDFEENTTYYVTVNPYNSWGTASCSEFSFTTGVIPVEPVCTTITSPANGAPNVALDASITWTAVADADGYYVTIGTTFGGNELVDALDVTGTSYTHTSDFAENTTYYVSVVPYNAVGEATGCAEISFTTETLATVPNCTTITSLGNGATDVALDAAIQWTAAAEADGYHLTIGTTSGGTELVDTDVPGTSYSHPSDFAENTTYYVIVVPFNSVGDASGCSEISFTTAAANVPTPPSCTSITSPGNGATDVALDAAIQWTAASEADDYHLTIGTTSGGTELVDTDVTGTSYTHSSDFAENTTYYVTVVPFNAVGDASGCAEISFTTETLPVAPTCTPITSPGNGATDVALDAASQWTAAAGAVGYHLTIGTTSGGTELVDTDVTGTSYTHPSDFAENTTYYVNVVPFNAVGNATGCSDISFTTETLPVAPACTTITSPGNGATDVALDAAIQWTAAAGADDYHLTIGTTSGGTELVDTDVTGTSYTHPSDFAENTTYYVSVVPYNVVGEATGCAESSFTTETLATVPSCTAITFPGNGAADVALDASITWTAVADADGYYLTIGTTSGGNELVDALDITGTSYSYTSDFAENTTYYVSVVPYNAVGEATGCAESSFTTETLATVPSCTTITSPGNGGADVALDAAIQWMAAGGADGYHLTIGTSSGGTELVDIDVTGTSYTHPSDFAENTTYFVTVVPFNSVGDASGCSEISFTTAVANTPTPPACTTITSPGDGATDVALDAAFQWTAAAEADGYHLTIGTNSGGTEFIDTDVTGTSYTNPSDFVENTTYFVTVVPFNAVGDASGCAEISFTTETLPVAPACTTITSPGNGATDIALDAAIQWTAAAGADGYHLTIGTTSGGTELLNTDVTATSYTHPSDFAENTTYYVTVVPFNAVGDAAGCAEVSFTTAVANAPTPPSCTTITSPGNGATDIDLNATIQWTAAAEADGYHLTIGTTSGGNELVDAMDVTGTSYSYTSDFAENTTYYVSVVPYNAVGDASGCAEISFTTETFPVVPVCTTVTSPGNGATDVALDAAIQWTAASGADGYHLRIGTTSGGSQLVNTDVTGTSYTHPSDFAENTTYYVAVVPFNTVGDAAGCAEISFTTAVANTPTPPACTTITSPGDGATDIALDAAIQWTAASGANGYHLTIGTTSGGTELVDTDVTGASYSHPYDFAENTTYYVTVVPFNAVGDASGCTEISFTTAVANTPTPPTCTTITSPGNEATDIALNAAIQWTAAGGADGYHLTIGTTSGGTELVDTDVAGTSYTHSSDFAENTTYYVTVVPFNAVGDAFGCAEISFTTETLPVPPECVSITFPTNQSQGVSTNTNVNWEASDLADGYYLFLFDLTSQSVLINNQIVFGNEFDLSGSLEYGHEYELNVISFNGAGEASDCGGITFSTEVLEFHMNTKYGISPNGDGINDVWVIEGIENFPQNHVSIFNRWGDQIFETQSYDNQEKVFDGEANRLGWLGAKTLPEGTYFFEVVVNSGEKREKFRGFLVIKR